MKRSTTGYSFSDILRHLAKQSAEKNLRIGFNLWQFAKDLQDQGVHYELRKKSTNTSRTTA